MIGRRGFITGLISLVAAPAIVRAGSLMPVKVFDEAPFPYDPRVTFGAIIDINDNWLGSQGPFPNGLSIAAYKANFEKLIIACRTA